MIALKLAVTVLNSPPLTKLT